MSSQATSSSGPASTEEAVRYSREKVSFRLLGMGIDYAFLFLMAFAGGAWLSGLLEPYPAGNRWLHLIEFTAAFGLLSFAVGLPLSFYSGYVHEHKYKLSNQTVSAWLWRTVKMLLVSSVFGLVVFVGLFAIVWAFPNWWWLVAAGAMLLLSVVVGQLFPKIVPLFYKLEPVQNSDLVSRFRKLAEGTGISIETVLKMGMSRDTKKSNAMLTGMGKAKRVMLGDTLLNDFPVEEIETVFAHELGHSIHRHLVKGIVLSTVSTLVGLFICDVVLRLAIGGSGFGEVSQLPLFLLVLSLFNLVTRPLDMAVTRHFERQCDWYALEKTKNPVAYRSAFARLGSLNKSDNNPPRWVVVLFHSHPPIAERIAMADRWEKGRRTS